MAQHFKPSAPLNIQPRSATTHRAQAPRSRSWFGALAAWGALLAFAVAPYNYDLPAAIPALLVFLFVQATMPACRPNMVYPLCPANLAQMFFVLHVVTMPLVTAFYGFSQGTLPWLPSDGAINGALLVSTAAYGSFATAYAHFHKQNQQTPSLPVNDTATPRTQVNGSRALLGFYAVVGLVGFVMFFGGWSGYLNYVSSPTFQAVHQASAAGTLQGAAATFLRPFLGAAIVLAWARWSDRKPTNMWLYALVTFGAVCAVLLVNFSYNRGTMIGPLVAMAAAFSLKVRRISFKALAFVSVVVLFASFVWGNYRGTRLVFSELLAPGEIAALLDTADVQDTVQVYGQAPQFLGFLLEETGWGRPLYWGKTLVPSLVYPVPILGKPFRDTSAVAIYNNLIYNDPNTVDQIVPFQGELFINFHIIGVLMGYVVLAKIAATLQRKFERSRTTFEAYGWFFISLWTLFLITGSLAVTSQMYVFFFWPLYLYALWTRFVGRRSDTTAR